jgi:hypothetical protein
MFMEFCGFMLQFIQKSSKNIISGRVVSVHIAAYMDHWNMIERQMFFTSAVTRSIMLVMDAKI